MLPKNWGRNWPAKHRIDEINGFKKVRGFANGVRAAGLLPLKVDEFIALNDSGTHLEHNFKMLKYCEPPITDAERAWRAKNN